MLFVVFILDISSNHGAFSTIFQKELLQLVLHESISIDSKMMFPMLVDNIIA